MKEYTVGRQSPDSDIVVNDSMSTVSRKHIKISNITSSSACVTDLDSVNGTFRVVNSEPTRIYKENLRIDEELFLGKYRTTIEELIGSIQKNTKSIDKRFKRNPKTGEIEEY